MSCNGSVASKNTIRYSLSPASFLDELFKEDNQCQGPMLMNPENAMYTCKKCKIELMLSDCNSKKCVVKELFKQQLLQNQCRDMKAECERCKRVYHTCPYLDCNKYALADHKSKPGDSYKFRCIQRHLETHKQDRKKKRSRSKDDSLDQDISSAGLFFADALNNLEMCKKQIQSITYCFDQCMKDLSHSQLLNWKYCQSPVQLLIQRSSKFWYQ